MLWTKGIISELTTTKDFAVFEDNELSIKAVTKENGLGRLKHFDIKLKFVYEDVKLNHVKI